MKVGRPDKSVTKFALNEVHVMQRMRQSRYFVAIWDAYHKEAETTVHILEEGMTGGDLEDFLRSKRGTWKEKLQLFSDTLSGMVDMHKEGLVHRDLKPANIMVTLPITGGFRAKIGDVASACSESGTDEVVMACSRGVGTYAYQPPEHYNGKPKPPVTDKDDTWALGIVLYEIVFGARPKAIEDAHSSSIDVDSLKKKMSVALAAFKIDKELEAMEEQGRHHHIPQGSGWMNVKKLLQGLLHTNPTTRMSSSEAQTVAKDAATNGFGGGKAGKPLEPPPKGTPPSCFVPKGNLFKGLTK
jgi:serine/threonine protein kinase